MINVKFKKVSGNLVSFKVNGHADFDEYNRDIVCSAVSVLTYAIINGITDVVKVNADFEIRDGFSTLSLEKQPLRYWKMSSTYGNNVTWNKEYGNTVWKIYYFKNGGGVVLC